MADDPFDPAAFDDPFDPATPPSGDSPDETTTRAEPGASWEALSADLGLGPGHGTGGLRCVELCPICRTADVLRAAGPPELRGQLHDLQREALVTLRALLDHYIERLDDDPAEGAGRVEEIPIE